MGPENNRANTIFIFNLRVMSWKEFSAVGQYHFIPTDVYMYVYILI